MFIDFKIRVLVQNTTLSVSGEIFKIRLCLQVISSFLEELVLKYANRTSRFVFLTANQLSVVILLSVHHCPKPLARVSLGQKMTKSWFVVKKTNCDVLFAYFRTNSSRKDKMSWRKSVILKISPETFKVVFCP